MPVIVEFQEIQSYSDLLHSLPGTPCFVDTLLTDHMKREEDPEAYDACRAFLVDLMEGGEEMPLAWYSPYMAGFFDGWQAATKKVSKTVNM